MLHRDRRLLLRVGKVGHIGKQNENALSVQRKALRNGKRKVGDEGAFDGRVCRRVNEHHRVPHRAAHFQRVPEKEKIVVFEPHAAQNNHVHFRLHRNARQKFVVGLARYRKDGKFLAFHQRIEHVYHRNARTYHLFRDDPARRIDGRPADGDHVFRKRGALVFGNARAREDAAEKMFGIGDHHRLPQKFDGIGSAYALCARKDLQVNEIVVQLDDVCIAAAYQRQISVAHALGTHGNDIADDRLDFCVDLLHIRPPAPKISTDKNYVSFLPAARIAPFQTRSCASREAADAID